MYRSIKQELFSNWHPMRMLRLVLSVVIIIEAISMHDLSLGAFGGVFMLMAIFNAGCCGTACHTRYNKTSTAENEKVEFEEIK